MDMHSAFVKWRSHSFKSWWLLVFIEIGELGRQRCTRSGPHPEIWQVNLAAQLFQAGTVLSLFFARVCFEGIREGKRKKQLIWRLENGVLRSGGRLWKLRTVGRLVSTKKERRAARKGWQHRFGMRKKGSSPRLAPSCRQQIEKEDIIWLELLRTYVRRMFKSSCLPLTITDWIRCNEISCGRSTHSALRKWRSDICLRSILRLLSLGRWLHSKLHMRLHMRLHRWGR